MTMHFHVGLSFITCLLLIWKCSARSESEATAECIAGCLKTFKNQVSVQLHNVFNLRPDLINMECGKLGEKSEPVEDQNARSRCHTCTYTCNHYGNGEYKSHTSCNKFCEITKPAPTALNGVCNETCNTLQRLRQTNQGQCPRPAQTPQNTASCRAGVLSCNPQSDQTCHGLKIMKCCHNGCGYFCLESNITAAALPKIPKPPLLETKNTKNEKNIIELNWNHFNITSFKDPIVFLIQIKSHKSYKFEAAFMAAIGWQDLAVTSRTVMDIGALEKGTWYLFRLAAISADGFLGYSDSSDPFKLADEPTRPSRVRQLQEGISRVHDRKVDVQIMWKQPESSDLPIAKYEVKWCETLGNSRETSLTKFQTHVPGTTTEFYLPNLKPGATYQVYVWAIAYYGSSTQLRSRKNTLYVSTMKIPEIVAKPTGAPVRLLPDCSCQDKPETHIVTKTPYFENDDLQMLVIWSDPAYGQLDNKASYIRSFEVKWTQRVCIESASLKAGDRTTRETTVHNRLMYTLTGLKFDCHYSLQIKALTDTGHEAMVWNSCFCTPSCKETTIKGLTVPVCPNDDQVHMPQPPINLQYSIVDSLPSSNHNKYPLSTLEKTYIAKITWGAPEMLTAIKGFRITWGPRLYEDVNPKLYSRGLEPKLDPEKSYTSIVDARERQFYLSKLKGATIYIVKMQTITVFKERDSVSRSIYFATPGEFLERSPYPNSEVQKYINPGNKSAGLCRASLPLTLTLYLYIIHWWWRDHT